MGQMPMIVLQRPREWPGSCLFCMADARYERGPVVGCLSLARELGGPVPLEWFCDTYCGARLRKLEPEKPEK